MELAIQRETSTGHLKGKVERKLKGYFGSDLDWYGVGENPIDSKWEGLKDYKYHIIIENGQKTNLMSEKLFDSYTGLSFPIYFGAPNTTEYFSKNSFLLSEITQNLPISSSFRKRHKTCQF